MFSVKATVEIPVEVTRVYGYLRNRHEGQPYRSACMEAKGYIPPVACLESIDNAKLVFFVPGRDVWLRLPIGGWTWSYQMEDMGSSKTRIRTEYRWHWLFAFLGFGTVKHQAANAITEDVLAMQALASTGS